MKISFSRKGFDSASGGAPSAILDGRPVSLPIPTSHRSQTSYDDLGLGEIVAQSTGGRMSGSNLCHYDPMFEAGRCAFGQAGAAQSHLARHGFGVGDIFLFFGLFADDKRRDRHHRIFGYLRVAEMISLGAAPEQHPASRMEQFRFRHPHLIGEWNDNNTLYIGQGGIAKQASAGLRLSKPGKSVSCWQIPHWLPKVGLTYHANPKRWAVDGELNTVARGQEFIADIGDDPDAHQWLADIITQIDDGAVT